MSNVIHTDEAEGFVVRHDAHDPVLPYGFAWSDNDNTVWVTPEALDLVNGHRGAKDSAGVKASDITFNEGLFRLAAVHDKTVTFRYAKGELGTSIETRRLEPESVKDSSEGDRLVVGFDPDRCETRSYRLDRIKGEVSVA